MNHPFFSIVIPTFNRANLVRAAIASVQGQTFPDWEVIVIDDGSSDDTGAVIAGLKDPRVRYFFQPNQGKSAARNAGILRAQGLFICFLDSDDYYLANHLEALYSVILQQEKKVGIFRTGMLVEGQTGMREMPLYTPASGVAPLEFFARNMVGTDSLCIHRCALEQERFDTRFLFFQDTHLFLRLLSRYPFFQIPKYTCVCREHGGRSSYDLFRSADAAAQTLNNVAAIRNLFEEYGHLFAGKLPPWMEDFLVSEKFLDHASGALTAGKYGLALRWLFNSLRYNRRGWFFIRYVKLLALFPIKLLTGKPRFPDA